MTRRRSVVLGVLVVTGILAATMIPAGPVGPAELCAFCGQFAGADAARNTMLFVPLGALLAAAGWRAAPAVLVPGLLSVAIEVVQLFLPGRWSSLADVIANTLGAALGVLLVRTAARWLWPPPRRAAWLAIAGAVGAALALAATTALVRPALPDSRYFGQWTPRFASMAWYRGFVDSVTLGGQTLPDGEIPASGQARAGLLAGLPLHVRASAARPTEALAPIFAIADDRQRGILLIGADRDDLVLVYRTRAAAMRFDQPDFRLAGALRAMRPGERLDIVVDRIGPHPCITINARRTCPSLGPLVGWALVWNPGRLTPAAHTAASVAWLAMLLLPSCYWTVCMSRRAR